MTRVGQVDVKATQLSIDRLIQNGVSGVIVLPMLGENASLTLAEPEKVIRAAAEIAKSRVPLLSGLAEITYCLPSGDVSHPRGVGDEHIASGRY